jgi:alkylhydroperoxidase family enzyme
MHSRDLLKAALKVDKLVLVSVWHDAGGIFSKRERAALAWVETVTRVAETGVPDADYAAAAAEYGTAQPMGPESVRLAPP